MAGLSVEFTNFLLFLRDGSIYVVTKVFDGIEPDNVDGYQNNTGFKISNQESVEVLIDFWAAEAHKRGLSIGFEK